ncbi:MAG: hypothetical protein N3A66_04255, partial [Planctomycetota bacterium]|nr:hypothetical protein [Planctomycetota bacterium]
PARLHFRLAGPDTNLSASFGHNAEATATLEGHAGRWPALATLRCGRLDLSDLTEAAAQEWLAWLRWLGRRDCRLAIRADMLSCYFVAMREAQVDTLLNAEGCHSLIAQGRLAGGACRLQAASLPLGWRMPSRFICEIEGAEAAAGVAIFSPWLPPPLQATVTAGKVNFSLRCNAIKRAAEPHLTAACHFTSLGIASAAAGNLWREILSLPAQLAAAEALIRKARSQPPAAEKKSALPALRFAELTIQAKGEEDGSATFEIHGRSPDLGRLDGLGRREHDGALRGALTLRELPSEVIDLAGINPEMQQAFKQQMEEGLRLDFSLTGKEVVVEHRYVQDIFRLWAEEAGRSERETPP